MRCIRASGATSPSKELVDLTLAIIAINGWNRLALSFRTVPGSYVRDKAGTPAEVVL